MVLWSQSFYENCMILNPEKYHYICLGTDSVSALLRFCGEDFEASELETVYGYRLTTKQTLKTILNLSVA